MRKPQRPQVVLDNDISELQERSAKAEELGKRAPLTYQSQAEGSKTPKKIKAAVDDSSNQSLLDSLTGASIFALKSNDTRKHNISMNRYEKAALYVVAKSESISMHQFIKNEFLAMVVKKAEKMGMNENTVKEIYEKDMLK